MKTINDFKEYFDNKYNETVKLYEKTYYNMEQKSKRNNISVFSIITLLILIFLFVLREYVSFNFFVFFILFYLIISVLILFGLKIKFQKQINYEINKLIFYDCLTFFSDGDKKYCPNKRISKDYFSKSNFFNLNKYNYNGSNFCSISLDKCEIMLSDFNIYDYKYKTIIENFYKDGKYYRRTINRKIPFDIFKGLYIEISSSKTKDIFVYMISNDLESLIKNRFSKLLNYDGVRVNLENLDFEKYYNVYSEDEVKARCIFELDYMEKLVSIENIISQKKFLVYKPDGKISLFISGFTIEDMLKKSNVFVNKKISYDKIYKFFEKISKIFELVKIIK